MNFGKWAIQWIQLVAFASSLPTTNISSHNSYPSIVAGESFRVNADGYSINSHQRNEPFSWNVHNEKSETYDDSNLDVQHPIVIEVLLLNSYTLTDEGGIFRESAVDEPSDENFINSFQRNDPFSWNVHNERSETYDDSNSDVKYPVTTELPNPANVYSFNDPNPSTPVAANDETTRKTESRQLHKNRKPKTSKHLCSVTNCFVRQKSSHRNDAFKCYICGKETYSDCLVRTGNFYNYFLEPIGCRICGLTWQNKRFLTRHLRTKKHQDMVLLARKTTKK